MSQEVALLLLTLAEPGTLPFFVRELDPARARRLVSRLVLDGALEIEHDQGFVSGPEALEALGLAGSADAGRRLEVRLERLSLEALRWTATLPAETGAARLAHRLYAYNSLPVTPAHRHLDGVGGVERFLGLDRGGSARKAVDRDWLAPSGRGSRSGKGRPSGWLSYRSRRVEEADGAVEAGVGRGDFKLYLSPLPDAMPALLPTVLPILASRRARGFKVGAGRAGLLRPDKMVAYFDRRVDLERASSDLVAAVSSQAISARPQGVPLTAAIDSGGLLSWGVDPPDTSKTLSWRQRESWRWWLARRFVAALDSARRMEAGEPGRRLASEESLAGAPLAEASPVGGGRIEREVRFGLESLRARGVDVERWIPTSAG